VKKNFQRPHVGVSLPRTESYKIVDKKMNTPTTLFLDIGNVLLSNGWDHSLRSLAAQMYGLDIKQLNERHHLTYDTYEEGKLSLDTYLDRVVFYEKRPFTKEEFKAFIFVHTQPHQDMIDYIRGLKERYSLKVVAVSNEGRELMQYRIDHFELHTLFDFFIGSCFVHMRKPDLDFYRLALDVAQVEPHQVLYIDDRPMFVQIAKGLGIQGIVHRGYPSTSEAMQEIWLEKGIAEYPHG
jgi:putative hydrolase of the HAD superfamily